MQVVIGGKTFESEVPGRGLRDIMLPFKGDKRSKVNQIVIHESVTSTGHKAVQILKSKGCGVHFLIEPNGQIEQWADLSQSVFHAKRHNDFSVGIEVVGLYYPGKGQGIPAAWADKGKDGIKNYLVPPTVQLETLLRLITWLTDETYDIVSIPKKIIGLTENTLSLGVLPEGNKPSPGIWAHGQQWWISQSSGKKSNHADGRFPLAYVAVRMAGIDSDTALKIVTDSSAKGSNVMADQFIGLSGGSL